jgi:uncharacterized protein (DUF2141 family)
MLRLLISALIILIWSACANKVPPTGGPKDETPPNLVASIPKDGNTNVKSTELTLLFDELIIAKNIKKELLITPRIDFDYEYKIKKNTIILNLEQPLDSATTYTFNFRNSIVDITEGNPAVDLVLAFSTGPVLDTLEIEGNINDLLTEKPIENLVVGLYNTNDTTNLFNSPPYYFAKTDKKGNFLFRNIKPDEYTINAFVDSNNNLTCQTDREAYAFSDTSIKLDSNYVTDTLKLQLLNVDTLKLKRTRNSGQYYVAVSSKYLTELDLKTDNDSTLWYSLGKEKKEIKIYNTFPIVDSLLVELSMTDSINSHVTDTFYLKFPESERKYDEYEIKVTEPKVYPETRQISFSVKTSKPSKLNYVDSLRITVDTLSTIYFDSTWNIVINKNFTEFELNNYLPNSYLDSIGTLNNSSENSLGGARNDDRNVPGNKMVGRTPGEKTTTAKSNFTYDFEIPHGTFQSIESDSSKHKEFKLKPKYNKDFGILMGEIRTNFTHYFIQLLDKNYNQIFEITQGSSYKFKHIIPGDYLVRIMIDSNKNGKWDAGNILLNQLPEPVIFYKNEDGNSKTTIRANWEISLDLSF